MASKRWDQGEYKLENPGKYVSPRPPHFRSNWERQFMQLMDQHPFVHNWGYEPLAIQYIHPMKPPKATSFYYPDFYVNFTTGSGKQRSELVEIKPIKEAHEMYAKSQRDMINLAVNQAKWEAARAFCDQYGWYLHIMTEKELFGSVLKGK